MKNNSKVPKYKMKNKNSSIYKIITK